MMHLIKPDPRCLVGKMTRTEPGGQVLYAGMFGGDA